MCERFATTRRSDCSIDRRRSVGSSSGRKNEEAKHAVTNPRASLRARGEDPLSGPMAGLKLGRGAMLLFEATRAPESADLEAIAAAAAPLLAVLEKRGLLAEL